MDIIQKLLKERISAMKTGGCCPVCSSKTYGGKTGVPKKCPPKNKTVCKDKKGVVRPLKGVRCSKGSKRECWFDDIKWDCKKRSFDDQSLRDLKKDDAEVLGTALAKIMKEDPNVMAAVEELLPPAPVIAPFKPKVKLSEESSSARLRARKAAQGKLAESELAEDFGEEFEKKDADEIMSDTFDALRKLIDKARDKLEKKMESMTDEEILEDEEMEARNDILDTLEKAARSEDEEGYKIIKSAAEEGIDVAIEALKQGINGSGLKPKKKARKPRKKTGPSRWTIFLKDYAARHGVTYREAMKLGRDEYYNLVNEIDYEGSLK